MAAAGFEPLAISYFLDLAGIRCLSSGKAAYYDIILGNSPVASSLVESISYE